MSAASISASSSIRRAKVAASTLGGQGISVVAYSENKDAALQYIKWFAQGGRAEEVVVARRLFVRQVGAGGAGLRRSRRRSRRTSCVAMGRREGLLAGAVLCASCCRPCRSACTTMWWPIKGTAKEALDLLIKDWTEDLQGRRADLTPSNRPNVIPGLVPGIHTAPLVSRHGWPGQARP